MAVGVVVAPVVNLDRARPRAKGLEQGCRQLSRRTDARGGAELAPSSQIRPITGLAYVWCRLDAACQQQRRRLANYYYYFNCSDDNDDTHTHTVLSSLFHFSLNK